MSKQTELIVPNNHIALTSVNDVASICQPLFQHTDINVVWYARYYPDDTVTILCSHEGFHKCMLGDMSDIIADWKTLEDITSASPKLWDSPSNQYSWLVEDVSLSDMLYNYANRFNMRSGLEITEKLKDCYEVFWFDSTLNTNLNSFYFSNIPLLENFILYFREQATHIINKSEKQKIIVPNRRIEYATFMQQTAETINCNNSNIITLHNQLTLKQYPLPHNRKTFNLSPKEFNCLHYLARGYSQKEIGRTCGISDRTVESHLDKIKGKLNIHNKKELIELFYASRLARLKPIIDTGDKR
ncbi:MAG: helix-turn-helix transcriptional regulator [Gammaproteobacteria bacterium]|nr:helix-turn-helix transcriptional regulator [Gammaproteobacteria bacterium]